MRMSIENRSAKPFHVTRLFFQNIWQLNLKKKTLYMFKNRHLRPVGDQKSANCNTRMQMIDIASIRTGQRNSRKLSSSRFRTFSRRPNLRTRVAQQENVELGVTMFFHGFTTQALVQCSPRHGIMLTKILRDERWKNSKLFQICKIPKTAVTQCPSRQQFDLVSLTYRQIMRRRRRDHQRQCRHHNRHPNLTLTLQCLDIPL
jgi:hypothetical protein